MGRRREDPEVEPWGRRGRESSMAEAEDRAALSSGNHCINAARGGGVTEQKAERMEETVPGRGLPHFLEPNLQMSVKEQSGSTDGK